MCCITCGLRPGITGGGGSVTGNGSGSFSIAGGGSTQGRIEYMVDGIPNTTAHNSGGVVFIPQLVLEDVFDGRGFLMRSVCGDRHHRSSAMSI